MQYYFAPMEGLTDSVYRRLHHKYFPGIHRYYMPFLSPTVHRCLTPREIRELPPADTEDFYAVPQLMTRCADDFVWAAQQCADLGYQEVNLNAGCPSGTVVSKGKGSGMLGDPDALALFLDEVCSRSPLPVSVKTRLGISNSDEFPALLEIYNQYPLCELIVHPRVRKQFYDGAVDEQMFSYAVENSKIPLCYNGNLASLKDIAAIEAEYPPVSAVMLGRGLISDPGMVSPGGTSSEALAAFMEELLDTYIEVFGSGRNAMFRLKENWSFLLPRISGGEKLGKQLRKTTDLSQFRSISTELLKLPLPEDWSPNW